MPSSRRWSRRASNTRSSSTTAPRTASSTGSRRSSRKPPRTPGNARSTSSSATRARRSPFAGGLGRLDVQDLVLQRPARRGYLDDLALLAADDGAADGRLVRQLLLRRVGLRGADDPVLDRLVGVHVLQADLRTDRDRVGR